MVNIVKHTGKLDNTGQKCIVVYRKIPDDENNALIYREVTIIEIIEVTDYH